MAPGGSKFSPNKAEEGLSSNANGGCDVDVDVGMAKMGIVCNDSHASISTVDEDGCGVPITCFSEVLNDVTLHFQIIRLPKQIYIWVGSNSSRLGRLYAAAPTRPSYTVGVSSLLGGASDNAGSGIARRLVLKTGLNVILACNIPKDSPMIEAGAEKILVQKLVALGYTKPRCEGLAL